MIKIFLNTKKGGPFVSVTSRQRIMSVTLKFIPEELNMR